MGYSNIVVKGKVNWERERLGKWKGCMVLGRLGWVRGVRFNEEWEWVGGYYARV